MKTRFLLLIILLGLTVSCKVGEEYAGFQNSGDRVFYASNGDSPVTKTVLQGDGSIKWSPGDKINLFYGESSFQFTSANAEAASEAEFRGRLDGIEYRNDGLFWAVYPYDGANTFDGESVGLTLPSEQTAVEDTFADDLFISLARTAGNTLVFYNLCGGVKFSVEEAGIKSVTFSGNDGEILAGTLTVGFDDDGHPVVKGIENGLTEITLTAPEGETLQPGKWYYIVTIPAALTNGYTMTFNASEGSVGIRAGNSRVTIKRATWGELTKADNKAHEAVDLGLPSGLKWAAYNVGATKPEDYGDYFAWGETEPKSDNIYSWETYKHANGAVDRLTKYCPNDMADYWAGSGNPDGKIRLDAEDDAAAVNWGGSWRMPTSAEFDELKNNCTSEWTSVNGVNGCKFTGPNGNSIFLPAAGCWRGSRVGFSNNYWSLYVYGYADVGPYFGQGLSFDSEGVFRSNYGRYYGCTVRPVLGELSAAEISLEPSSLDFGKVHVGSSSTKTVTVKNTGTRPLTFHLASGTDDYSFAPAGEVTVAAGGTATLDVTFTPRSAGQSDSWIAILSNAANGTMYIDCYGEGASSSSTDHEAVDLGLPSGLKWATMNVGATKPEEYGDYFAWGETEPYYSSQNPLTWKDGKSAGYDWASYKWCNGTNNSLTKYNNSGSYGTVDNKTTLDLEDDAARANWGGSWRMPTRAEFDELLNNCDGVWATQNGVSGYKFTAKNGSGNSIFLPAAGLRYVSGVDEAGSIGFYWSSSLHTGFPGSAWYLPSGGAATYYYSRYIGQSVRPVTE